jgi:hypothetical protein
MTNLYALIVGIEKYDLPNWSRSGPVAGAIEMAYWCNSIGMPFKNLYMFLSINDQDPTWISGQQSTISHFRKTGATIVEDTSLNAIDTFWRNTLPTLPNGDSKLLVYWCGHGVTGTDRDRILLHTDYRPDNLSIRVTSADNLVASLATQTYRRFKEQLIVADVCGDFSNYLVSPNAHPTVKPVGTVTQHCYFATVDGQPTQIQNGIGQFTQSTLEVLSEYPAWPNLDELKIKMDKTFRNGGSKAFKIWIRTPQEEYDEIGDKSDHAKDATMQPSSEDVKKLISTCNEHIKRNELDELFQRLEDFLASTKSTAFDQERNSLQILQSDLTNFRMGELNGTLTPDTDTQRRILITKIQKLLKRIESKDAKQTNKPSNLKPSSFSSGESFSSDVIGKNSKEIASKGNQIRSLDSNSYWTGNGVVTSIEFTLDRPLGEFDESAFMSAFRQCTGIDAKKIRIASIRPGSTIVRVEGDPDVLQRVLEQFVEYKEKLHLFCQLTGLTSLQWAIDGRSYKLDVLQANELTPMTRNTNTDDKDAGQDTTYTIGIITALEKEYAAVSRVSSSPPSVPPKSHHDFFREQIYKLLDGNDELTAVFAQAIFSKNQKWDKNSVVDHFVVKSEKKNDFPLRRLKVVLDSLAAKRIELKQDSCQTLTILIEILTIASYPIEDSQTIEKAMQEILDTDTGNPTTGSLSTSKIEDAKKLLIATRIKLLGSEFSDLNIAKIFNRSITADNEVRLLLRKIHVVAAPAQKKDELTLIEFYSKAIIDDLGYEQNSKSYQDDLEDVLEQRSKVSAVISLLIPNENIEAIKQLRQRFPLLLVVELPKDSIGLYNAIFRDLKDIDECLPLLCGTVKRIT